MEDSLARIKERLEKEMSMHIETKQRISELQDNLETLSRQINNEKSERKRLEQLVASGSLPDDAKATLKIVEDEVLEKVETKPTPPPPPPPPLAPPPPPCMMPAAPPPMKVIIILFTSKLIKKSYNFQLNEYCQCIIIIITIYNESLVKESLCKVICR